MPRFIHSVINHNTARHSRESGNPERHWIADQARNDRLYKTYVVMLRMFHRILKPLFPICLIAFCATFWGGEGLCQLSYQEPIFSHAQSLWDQSKWDDAVLSYEEYLNKNPDGLYAAEAYMNLGQYLEGYNRLEEALEFY